MTPKKILQLMLVALALTIAVGARANSKGSRSVVLHYNATLAGSQLAMGKYNVQWQTHSPAATVSILQGSKVVATAEGKVVDRGRKFTSDAVMYDESSDGARVIREIRFKGSSEVIEINQ